jgi:hypothetical protein
MILVGFQCRELVLLFLEEMIKNMWPSLMCPDAFWKFLISHLSFHTAFHCYPALLFLFPQCPASILLCHPLHPNLALRSNCLKIHSLMFLKCSVLARIMRHFGGRLSFPQFVVLMTINTFTIPTNLPFRFRYHLPLPSLRSSWSTNLFGH